MTPEERQATVVLAAVAARCHELLGGYAVTRIQRVATTFGWQPAEEPRDL